MFGGHPGARMSYLQAIVIALVQGVTELFPVSSLGHSVLVPAWLGGSWQTLVTQSSQADSASSFYLAYIVALHCATALALLWFFRADWVRIIRGFFASLARSIRERAFIVRNADERLAWLIVLATIPVGITGLALEHVFRTVFAKPLAASIFLFINGIVLLLGERARRTAEVAEPAMEMAAAPVASRGGGVAVAERPPEPGAMPPAPARGARSAGDVETAVASDRRIAGISFGDGVFVGSMQVFALLPGISRSGITMVGGLWRGLSHEDAARFAFLLATPVIFAAGVLKLPSLAGPAGDHIHGQVLVGVVITGVTAYLSVRYLVRYFETRTLTPFAIYCLIAGAASIARFAIG
jgi:undecaprenyl-diphosphatase